jgi:hypothetical protein
MRSVWTRSLLVFSQSIRSSKLPQAWLSLSSLTPSSFLMELGTEVTMRAQTRWFGGPTDSLSELPRSSSFALRRRHSARPWPSPERSGASRAPPAPSLQGTCCALPRTPWPPSLSEREGYTSRVAYRITSERSEELTLRREPKEEATSDLGASNEPVEAGGCSKEAAGASSKPKGLLSTIGSKDVAPKELGFAPVESNEPEAGASSNPKEPEACGAPPDPYPKLPKSCCGEGDPPFPKSDKELSPTPTYRNQSLQNHPH